MGNVTLQIKEEEVWVKGGVFNTLMYPGLYRLMCPIGMQTYGCKSRKRDKISC